MTAPNDPVTLAPDLAALVASLTNLASAFASRDTGAPVATEDALAQAAATAAIASKQVAAPHASAALTSANAASTSATNAGASATAAATSASNAAGSATTAASKASACAASVSTAGNGATNATNLNANAQYYATHAQALKQVTVPAQAYSGTNSGPANESVPVSVSFTAPCNGYVAAFTALDLASTATGNYTLTLTINGTQIMQDVSVITIRGMGFLYVTTGTAVLVTSTASTGATAPAQNAGLHLLAFFIPAAT
jgi:hypothetical protein